MKKSYQIRLRSSGMIGSTGPPVVERAAADAFALPGKRHATLRYGGFQVSQVLEDLVYHRLIAQLPETLRRLKLRTARRQKDQLQALLLFFQRARLRSCPWPAVGRLAAFERFGERFCPSESIAEALDAALTAWLEATGAKRPRPNPKCQAGR